MTVQSWKTQGANRIVSLLPADEMVELGLSIEPILCAGVGLTFTKHPIIDFGLPEPGAFAELVQGIAQDLHAGLGVAVHCRAGIGRSGMTTVGTLLALGKTVESAVADVSAARGVSIPDTMEQLGFLRDFASGLK